MTSSKKERIKIVLEEIKNAIEKELEKKTNNCWVRSIQILVPETSDDLHTIYQHQIAYQKEEYNKITNNFVDFEDKLKHQKPTRSLFYLKYEEPFKYCSYNNLPNLISQPYPIEYDEDYSGFPIIISGEDLKRLRGEAKLIPFWKEWKNAFEKGNYGYSSLWSYIRIPKERDGRNPIISAYVIFEGKLDYPGCNDDESDHASFNDKNYILLSLINKKIQDYLFNLILDLFTDSILRQATRAAISQVMARNTSHNIGAHVMNKLINANYLETFCSYVKAHDSCGKEHLKSYQPQKDYIDNDDDHKPFNQIAIFNNYVKCRMDYLADISFGSPLMQTNKYAWQDLFKELDKVRLLLEHISGLSNFNYKIEFKRNRKRFKGSKIDETDIEAVGDDLLVAIPNDILGTQAFYNILENIIRNTAKHATEKAKLTTFTVNFIDNLPEPTVEQSNILTEFIAVEVYDNIPVDGEADNLTDKDKEEYENKTGKSDTNITKIDWLVYNQNKKLNEDILQDNKLRSYSLGLVEMEASATYLRKRDVSYINHPSYEIEYDGEFWSRDSKLNKGDQILRGTNCRNFLKAFKTKEITTEFEKTNANRETETYTKSGYALGYRFFLLRPEVVLVVADTVHEDTDIAYLKEQGIWVVTKDKFKEELEKGTVYNHEFVLYAQAEKKENEDKAEINISELIEKNKTSLPIRILEISEKDIKNFLVKEKLEDFEKECWEKWEKKRLISAIQCEVHNNSHKVPFIISNSEKDRTCFNIVLLDHLYSEKGERKTYEEIKDVWKEHRDKKYYVEALSSLAQSKMPDFNRITNNQIEVSTEKFKDYPGKANNNPTTKGKIIEAAISKVIAIDERIQEAAEERNFIGVPYKELYNKMNVVVPDKKTLNLSENSFEKVKQDVENYIKCKVQQATEIDFILIHYSILERMYKKEEINTKLLNELIGESKINVVITSGRGTPDKLSEKVRFVSLSPVITAFMDVRSKYEINYLLNSSRKSNKI